MPDLLGFLGEKARSPASPNCSKSRLFHGLKYVTMALIVSTMASNRAPNASPATCFVGVDVGPTVIRAEVFSSTFDVLGKMKISSKPERGLHSTIERIERCVRYAADEADLALADVNAVGVGLPGRVDAMGRVTLNHGFGFKDVPLRQQLESRLGRPVHVGNIFDLACRAIQVLEGSHDSGDFGVLFPGAILAAGLVMNGEPVDLSVYPNDAPLLPPGAGNVVEWTEDPRFRAFRSRDFRRAVRKGNEEARLFLRNSVVEAATFAGRLIRTAGVSQFVLAGGAIDENKADMVGLARSTLASLLGNEGRSEGVSIQVTASELGDSAGMTGAALVAAQSTRSKEEEDSGMDRRPELAR